MKLLDDDKGKRYSISYSGLDRFRSCPEKYRAVLAGEVVDMPGEEAFRGIFAHAAVAEAINDQRKDGRPKRDVVDIVAEAADAEIANYEASGLEIPWTTGTLLHSVELFDVWHSKARRHIPNGHVEAEINFEIALDLTCHDLPVISRGFIDLIALDENVLIDWKFSGATHWTKDWWKHLRYDHQPTIYTKAAALLTSTEMEDWLFYYAVINPNNGNVHITPPIDREEADWDRLRLEVTSLIRLLETNPEGPWPLSPDDWHCAPRFCPLYRDYKCMGASTPPQWMRDYKDKSTYGDWLANHPTN